MSFGLPELVWPSYRCFSLDAPLPAALLDKPPAKLTPLIVKLVEREGPVHIEVIIERLGDLTGASPKDRRLGRVALGATYQGRKEGYLLEEDDYWRGVDAPVIARDRRRARGRAGEREYISHLEIADGVRRVIAFCPSRSVAEWMEVVSRSFGFDELGPAFGQAVINHIKVIAS